MLDLFNLENIGKYTFKSLCCVNPSDMHASNEHYNFVVVLYGEKYYGAYAKGNSNKVV